MRLWRVVLFVALVSCAGTSATRPERATSVHPGPPRAMPACGLKLGRSHFVDRRLTSEDVARCTNACGMGDQGSCVTLGIAHERAAGAPLDRGRARWLYEQACRADDVAGCAHFGRTFDSMTPGYNGSANDTRALDIYTAACTASDPWACNNLATLYELGLAVKKDPVRATELRQHSCDLGEPLGCLNVAIDIEAGRGRAKDPAKARAEFERLCASGLLLGCANAGRAFEIGIGGPKDTPRALDTYRRACEAGEAWSCASVGTLHQNGAAPLKPDPAEAARWYRRACDELAGRGCSLYGWLAENGLGVPRSLTTANTFYRRGCELRDFRGCNNVAWFEESGAIGGKKHVEAARTLYIEGCERGYQYACYNFGRLYENGVGVPPDAAEAVRWYKRACDGGESAGCAELGRMRELGKPPPADPAGAALLYAGACELGNAPGCGYLATLYETGLGVPRDLKRELLLFRKALRLAVEYTAQWYSNRVRDLETECGSGAIESCYRAGVRNEFGLGVARSVERAADAYGSGCAQGHALSCARLGVAHRAGRGVAKAPKKANAMFERACASGAGEACYELALAAHDAKVRASWLARACVLGALDGCALQASLSGDDEALDDACKRENGLACSLRAKRKDTLPKDAFASLEKGCRFGSGSACLDAARARVAGSLEVEVDVPKAYAHATDGCDVDDAASCLLAATLARTGKVHGALDGSLFEARACTIDPKIDAKLCSP